ncbi:hypothetical protein C3943_03275 [Lysinibacillus sp. B2A1]|nr:hypothetical protein C3943_03275 [Lysinibacillus sp. B2A1]
MGFFSLLTSILGDTTVNSLLTTINTAVSIKPLLDKFKDKSDLNNCLINSLLTSLDQQIKLTDSTKIKDDLTNVKSILFKEPHLITDELEKINYDINLLILNEETLRKIAMDISLKMGYSDAPEIIGRQMGQALVNFFIDVYLEELEPEQINYLLLKNTADTLVSTNFLNRNLDELSEENTLGHKETHRKLEELNKQLSQQDIFINSKQTPIEELNLELKEWCSRNISSQLSEKLYDEKFTIYDMYIPLNTYTYKLKERFLDIPALEKSYSTKKDIYSTLNGIDSPGKPILILGSPGMGKSTFTKWLLVQNYKNNFGLSIRIELKRFDFSGDFSTDFICYLNKYISTPIHQSYLSKLNLNLILDGLDEIKLNSFEEHEKFINEILDFNNTYQNIKIIITSRFSILNNRICDSLKNCYIVNITPFSRKQIKDWISNWEQLNGIQKNIFTKEFEQDIFSQPLMLYLFFRMLRENPSETEGDFNKLDIYRQLIEWTNGNEKFFTEDQLNLLSTFSINNADLKTLLKEFNENLSLAMLTNGKDTVSIAEVLDKDLLPTTINNTMLYKLDPDLKISKQRLSSILLIKTNTTFIQSFEIVDLFEFDFVHKSFKEYLASNAIVRKLIEMIELENEEFDTEIYKAFSTLKIIDNVEEFLFELLKKVEKDILKKIYFKLNLFFSENLLSHSIIDSIDTNLSIEIKSYFKDYSDITLRKMQCNLAECLITILSFLNDFLSLDNFALNEYKIFKLITIANSINYEFRFEPLGTIDLENSYLLSITLKQANFDGLNLSDSEIINCNLSMSSFINTGLQNTVISFSNLEFCNFTEANLYGSTISFSTLREADLSNAILNNVSISYSDLNGANLEYSDLRHCNFSDSNLSMVNIGNCKLDYANFTHTNLNGLIIDLKTYSEYKDILKTGYNFDLIDIVFE